MPDNGKAGQRNTSRLVSEVGRKSRIAIIDKEETDK